MTGVRKLVQSGKSGTNFEGRHRSSYQNNHIDDACLRNVRYCHTTAGSHRLGAQSLVCKEHVCSSLGPFLRHNPTDEVRFWCWTHIWWFDWSCRDNFWDTKFYGLLHSERNYLCMWRKGCGETSPWKWQRFDEKMGQRTFKVLQSARLDRQEAECKGSFCQRTTESFMLHFIFHRRGDSTLNHSFNNIVQFAPRGGVFCWSPG